MANMLSCWNMTSGVRTSRMAETKWPCQNQRIHSSSGRVAVAMAPSQVVTATPTFLRRSVRWSYWSKFRSCQGSANGGTPCASGSTSSSRRAPRAPRRERVELTWSGTEPGAPQQPRHLLSLVHAVHPVTEV